MTKIYPRALTTALALTLTFAVVPPSFAQTPAEHTVMVGGAPMYPSKNIIQNAVNSKDHTTLVAAVKAAGLVETLQGPGPFTVFAPTNAAFDKLPPGTVTNLLKPENKAGLVKVLTYHVVPGRLTTADLMRMVRDGKGTPSSRPCKVRRSQSPRTERSCSSPALKAGWARSPCRTCSSPTA